MYYAYIHARSETADASGIFYVGKGKGSRCYGLSPRNAYHGNIVKKHGAKNILVGKLECSSESTAFELERGLIKCLRRMGVRLSNLTDGGEGAGGYKFTPEDTIKQSRGMVEANKRPGVKEKRAASISLAWSNPERKNNWRIKLKEALASPEARQVKREAFIKGFTEETRAKLIARSKRGGSDPVVKFKIGGANRNTIWLTNYQTSERLRVSESLAKFYESFGWIRGRKWPNQ